MSDPAQYHVLRYSRAFAWFERLPRPLLRWFAAFAVGWHMLVTDVLAQIVPHMPPSDVATRGTVFAFAAMIYGIRAAETTMKGKP